MRFILDEHHLFVKEIIKSDAVLLWVVQFGMKPMKGGEQNIEVILINAFKVLHFLDLYVLTFNVDWVFEQVF